MGGPIRRTTHFLFSNTSMGCFSGSACISGLYSLRHRQKNTRSLGRQAVPELHTPGYVLPVLWHTAFIFFRGGERPPYPSLLGPLQTHDEQTGLAPYRAVWHSPPARPALARCLAV